MKAKKDQQAPLYADAESIARLFGVGLRTVRRLQSQGVIRAYKVGPRLVRFKISEVETALFKKEGAR